MKDILVEQWLNALFPTANIAPNSCGTMVTQPLLFNYVHRQGEAWHSTIAQPTSRQAFLQVLLIFTIRFYTGYYTL